ncbi:MAG: MBL fold metallo-hydrolase [Fusicatenibacter sp.]
MLEEIEVLIHSSIRITGEQIVYVDPFRVEKEYHDADVICITHDHYDHFSPEDIRKVQKPDSVLIVPEKMEQDAKKKLSEFGNRIRSVAPRDKLTIGSLMLETVPAYNNLKPFHPKSNGWVGYLLKQNGRCYYVAGDTDQNKDNETVSCDVALVPVGGTYTMNPEKAALFVNKIHPRYAIPTHYGSVVGPQSAGDEFSKQVNPSIRIVLKL